MKPILLFTLISLILLTGCFKITDPVDPVILPEMQYTDFGNREIPFGEQYKVDLNSDSIKDFSIKTLLVADAQLKRDYQRYYFGSARYTAFPVNGSEEVPRLGADTRISNDAFPGYNWWQASDMVAAQKVVPLNQPAYWEGNWQDAVHNYLPLRITANGGRLYYGWVEVSFSKQSGILVLHNAAVCKQSMVTAWAGR